MKASALIPVVALLLSGANAVTQHPHAEALSRRVNPRRHHAHEVERMIEGIKRREAAEEAEKRSAPQKRLVRKAGQTCRPRNPDAASASASASASSTSTSSSASASPTSTANVDNYAAAAATSSSTTAASSSSTTSAAAASASATTATSSSGANSGSLTPNGKKAGVSAGDSIGALGSHIGWWYNWAPTNEGTSSNSAAFVPMLWGGGTTDSTDASRLASFKALTSVPTWIIGPEEPDCAAGGAMSSGMTVAETAALWNSLMAPKGDAGSLLLSPSMCHQMAEGGWLGQFKTQITRDWDITNIHVNKNNMAGVKGDIDYYWNTYGKPIWVTEFACVDDSSSFIPCTDQSEINTFITEIVDLFESDSRVYGYAYSNGYGLGNVWPIWSNGGLSESGQTYLSAISKYH